MKNIVAACVVVFGMAGSARGETKEPAKKPVAGKKKAAAGPKKITVDLGGAAKMEMTLIPAGEFLMGSGESAEATAAFFKKTYDQNSLNANKFKDAASAAPRADYPAILLGHVPRHAGPISAVRRQHALQNRRGEGRATWRGRLESGRTGAPL